MCLSEVPHFYPLKTQDKEQLGSEGTFPTLTEDKPIAKAQVQQSESQTLQYTSPETTWDASQNSLFVSSSIHSTPL